MSRRGRNTNFYKQQLVIFNYEKGKSHRQIANLLDMKKNTVANIITRYKKEDRIKIPKRRRTRLLDFKDRRIIIKKIKEN